MDLDEVAVLPKCFAVAFERGGRFKDRVEPGAAWF
jgi:hypothetical protein